MSGERVDTQFGPYRLDELLGRGGMGEVYRAFDTEKERVVAVKLLNPGLAGDATFQERFRRESRAAARLGEPHVIPIHDWGEIDGVLFIDMRLVDGEDLRSVLRREAPLTPERAVGIIAQVSSALDAAHADGLVHRDIKPENILIGTGDFAYLVDFGIAHGADDTHLTQTGTAIGSIAYMAPELFDATAIGPSGDIYALTCVLFECLTGRVPHPAHSVSAAIKAAVLDQPPSVSEVNSDVPAGLDPVIGAGLAADPERRFATAGRLVDAAKRALAGEPDPLAGLVPGPVVGATTSDAESPTSIVASPTVIAPSGEQYEPTQVRRLDSGGAGPEPAQYPAATNFSGPQPPSGITQPGTTQYSGPQQFSGPQHFSAPQQYSEPHAYGIYGPPVVGREAPPRRDRSVAYVLLAIAAVAVIGVLVLGAIWLTGRSSTTQSASTPTTPTVTQTITPSDATPTIPPVATGPAAPPPGSSPCDGTVGVGTGVTSCAFAFSVRDEYLRTGPKGAPRAVTAYSPVTGASYPMVCVPEGVIVVCRGGTDAVVHIY
ncbi:serine/threonine-protein kinase [Gordonia soli]|nr:serine/threonine-protein kinase [Gordonia soli]